MDQWLVGLSQLQRRYFEILAKEQLKKGGGEIEISDSPFARILFPELARGGGKIKLDAEKLRSLASMNQAKKRGKSQAHASSALTTPLNKMENRISSFYNESADFVVGSGDINSPHDYFGEQQRLRMRGSDQSGLNLSQRLGNKRIAGIGGFAQNEDNYIEDGGVNQFARQKHEREKGFSDPRGKQISKSGRKTSQIIIRNYGNKDDSEEDKSSYRSNFAEFQAGSDQGYSDESNYQETERKTEHSKRKKKAKRKGEKISQNKAGLFLNGTVDSGRRPIGTQGVSGDNQGYIGTQGFLNRSAINNDGSITNFASPDSSIAKFKPTPKGVKRNTRNSQKQDELEGYSDYDDFEKEEHGIKKGFNSFLTQEELDLKTRKSRLGLRIQQPNLIKSGNISQLKNNELRGATRQSQIYTPQELGLQGQIEQLQGGGGLSDRGGHRAVFPSPHLSLEQNQKKFGVEGQQSEIKAGLNFYLRGEQDQTGLSAGQLKTGQLRNLGQSESKVKKNNEFRNLRLLKNNEQEDEEEEALQSQQQSCKLPELSKSPRKLKIRLPQYLKKRKKDLKNKETSPPSESSSFRKKSRLLFRNVDSKVLGFLAQNSEALLLHSDFKMIRKQRNKLKLQESEIIQSPKKIKDLSINTERSLESQTPVTDSPFLRKKLDKIRVKSKSRLEQLSYDQGHLAKRLYYRKQQRSNSSLNSASTKCSSSPRTVMTRKIGNWNLEEESIRSKRGTSSQSKYAHEINKYSQRLEALGPNK